MYAYVCVDMCDLLTWLSAVYLSSFAQSWIVFVPTLTLSPLSSYSVGSPDPELPDGTSFLTVFFNFQADISSLRKYIKDLQAGISALREFVTVGEASFLALLGETVKTFVLILCLLIKFYSEYCCVPNIIQNSLLKFSIPGKYLF